MKMMLSRRLQDLDLAIIGWMARFGPVLLRVSLGIVFLWFGALKFFPNLSPAQELATKTISILTGDLIPPSVSLPLLAGWECLIGLGLLLGRWLRGILFLLYVQMLGTLAPIVLFPYEVFVRIPYAPTLEGQVHHQESGADQRRYRGRGNRSWRMDCTRASKREGINRMPMASAARSLNHEDRC